MKDLREERQFAIGTWEIDLQTPHEREYVFSHLLNYCSYVDTAVNYNNDYVLKDLVPSSVKLISKLASCHLQCYDLLVDNHLKCLRRDTIDIMLIHSSRGNWRPLARRIEADSRFIEKGVSNFNAEELEEYKEVIGHYPAYNELEINPYYNDIKTEEFCREHGIKIIAYGVYGGKYNAMTNIANFSIPYLLKYAMSFADILILKPESERQTNEVVDVLKSYDFNDGNDIVLESVLDSKAIAPMNYTAKSIKKLYRGMETYSVACGQNKGSLEVVGQDKLPAFEMRGDYLVYVRYMFRQKYDGSPVYDYDFLVGDDGRYYVVYLYDEEGRITKINTGHNDSALYVLKKGGQENEA